MAGLQETSFSYAKLIKKNFQQVVRNHFADQHPQRIQRKPDIYREKLRRQIIMAGGDNIFNIFKNFID